MKKLFAVLSFLFIGSFSFADVWIQQNIPVTGVAYNYYSHWEDPLANAFFSDYWDGLSVTALYEFNSEEDSTIHWFAGADFGLSLCVAGLEFCGIGGFNTSIGDLGNWNMELNTALGLGATVSIFNTWRFYSQISSDFMFIAPGKNVHFFCGPGLIATFSPEVVVVKEGTIFNTMGIISPRLTAGIKF